MAAAAALKFTVRRRPVVLVSPAAPTPREWKRLSDIDDQDGLRFHMPAVYFYPRHDVSIVVGGQQDPAPVISDAIARALVHYYPLAGRLRELQGRKLAVDCTGQGVLFVEADADVRLEHFGKALQPPFPCMEKLLFDVPGSSETLNSPLLFFQVTRLACGGFILATRMQHAVMDAQGFVQFLGGVAELARGALAPKVRPVLATRRARASRTASTTMTFELLAGCLWKSRTMALTTPPEDASEEMRLIFTVNARARNMAGTMGIPKGYYGNAFAMPVAIATAGELRDNPVSYAVEMVRKAKEEAMGAEYIRSVADLMVLRGRPHFAVARAYLVTDVTKTGLGDLVFGLGQPVYGGPAMGGVGAIPRVSSFLVKGKNAMDEDGVVAPVCLPAPAMDRFAEEIRKLLRSPVVVDVPAPQQAGVVPLVMSAL
ncbi:hypothetical protein HU200_024006 [Digitaria exilis]|uniref:Benzyl alcohol O-benzoyltransferase n=1 Tax=Digitaria exilis TaxID=1010633 RepID=A0A835C6C9_9POAL|nr:hypothetical protein HU200_024006 [Digitaria exilis]